VTDQQTIAMRVRQVISEAADDMPVHELGAATRLKFDLGLDASERIALAYAIEREFNGSLDDAGHEAITNWRATVADVVTAVQRNLTTKEASA
jgi:acyl carrier protein